MCSENLDYRLTIHMELPPRDKKSGKINLLMFVINEFTAS